MHVNFREFKGEFIVNLDEYIRSIATNHSAAVPNYASLINCALKRRKSPDLYVSFRNAPKIATH